MSRIVKDRVKETASTSGLAAFTLAGAVANFVSFASRMAVGDTTYYCADSGTQWEVGIGTYSAANTLTRSAVLDSSDAGAPVNFTAAPTVFMTIPAAIVQSGGLAASVAFSARSTAGQGIANNVPAKVTLNAKDYDTAGVFDATTNSRFQPLVAGYYLVNFGINGSSGGASFYGQFANLYKNGADIANGSGRGNWAYGNSAGAVFVDAGVASTRIVYLNGTTDYLELYGRVVGSGALTVTGFMEGFLLQPTSNGVVDKARISKTNAQNTVQNNVTKILFNNVSHDTGGIVDIANSRITPKKAGYYECKWRTSCAASAVRIFTTLQKNGNEVSRGIDLTTTTLTTPASSGADTIYCNGTTDYLEVFVYCGGVIGLESFDFTTFLQVTGPF